GRRPSLLPDLADHLRARKTRQHPREQDEVELVGTEGLETRLAVVGFRQRMPEGLEQSADSLDVAGLVFDQKNFFGHELNLLSPETEGNQGEAGIRRTLSAHIIRPR